MRVSSYQHGKATIIAPREAIVEGECDDVRRSALEAVTSGSSELQATCADSGAHLKLASPDEVCCEIFRITDLAQQFQTYPSVEEATQNLV